MEPIRVLYVEDDSADQELTRRHLERHAPHLKLKVVATVAEALDQLAAGDVDVILTDYRLPDGTGLDLLETVKAREFPVPVVLVTGSGDAEAAVRLLKAGAADYVIKRSGYVETLPAVLEGTVRWFQSASEFRRTPVRVLYAEHDPVDAELMQRAFREYGRHFQIEVAWRGRDALERLRAIPYDLLLLDYRLPDLSGIEVLKALREERIRLPVVMVTGQGDEETAVQAFKLGAADYIIKREGSLAKLPSTLENVLAQRRLADEKDALLVLNGLTRSIATLKDLSDLAQLVAHAAADLLKVNMSIVWLVEGSELRPAGWVGIEESVAPTLRCRVDTERLERAAVERRMAISDLRGDGNDSRPIAAVFGHTGGSLMVSIVTAGRLVGVLAVASHRPRDFGTTENRLLTILADHTAIAIENTRLYHQLKDQFEKLQRAGEALRKSEERYRIITETATDAIVTIDTESKILFVNPATEQVFGYSRAEMLGQPLTMLMPESLRHVHRAGLKRYLDTARRNITWVGMELPGLHKSGKEIPLEISFGEFMGDDEHFFIGIVRDISERKQMEASLRQSEKLAAMGSLLAGVAHELNNPLGVVLGQTALLRHAVGGGPLAERAEQIAQAAKRCARIVQNFLALARQRPLERQRVLLNQVIEEAVELIAYPLRVNNVQVQLGLGPDLPVLWADPHQLHQVVVNLLTNADYAMRETAPPRRITLTTRHDPAQARVHLKVADTGPGIPAAIQGRIFEPFFTTKPPGQGTGLGLSLCHGIIKSHRGAIRVESPPGQGAVFVIELPVEAPPETDQEVQVAETLQPIRGRTILVVDDEPGIARTLAEMLALDGHQVETAPNGVLALAKLGERAYDLILSDLKMPELDGPGLYLEVARRHPALCRRFIFLTGDTLGSETEAFLDQTRAPSLTKPFELEDVRQAVRRILGEA